VAKAFESLKMFESEKNGLCVTKIICVNDVFQ